MFGFRRKPIISDDLRDWIIDSFDWADDTFGTDWRDSRQLVAPTNTFFTAPSGQTQAVAQAIANDIASLIPMRQIEVQPLAVLPDELRHSYQDLSSVAGSYLADKDAPLIRYDPSGMSHPLNFISTMTHELLHDRLNPYIHDMPGGEGAHELSTDLHCITHGFGLFALEGAAQVGWAGYMTNESRAFALAVFLSRHNIAMTDAMRHLTGRTQKLLTRALSELA